YTHALAAHREPLYPVLRHGQLLAALGLSLDGLQLELHLTAAERAQAAAALAQAGRREQAPLVAMAPAAEEADKVWPPERYAQVADALVELTGAQILLLGAGPEQPWLEAVRACMRLAPLPPVPVPDLRHAAALLERATLYLGADTVTRHMAMALDLPSVTIVGRADPRVGTPPGQMAHVALAYDPGCKARCTFPHCLHLSCVATIPAESVLRAALRALGIAEPGARPAPWPAAAGAGQRERLPLAR
ncbi:MAG TPA: glycosyltransferase family 9 protein, partial [bacterium]|nr:glycosyltransferase family 9 protein [bacterium]